MSMDPRSFSLAFLLSINCPSGITPAFSTLYLWKMYQNTSYLLIRSLLGNVIFTWSHLPLLKVTILDSAGEALCADSDTLQNTITPQLVDNQEVLHETYNEQFTP